MRSLLFATIFLLCIFQALSAFEPRRTKTKATTDIQKNPFLKDLLELGRTQFIRRYNIKNGLSFAPTASASISRVRHSQDVKGLRVSFEVKMQDLKGKIRNVILNILRQPWRDWKGLESFSVN